MGKPKKHRTPKTGILLKLFDAPVEFSIARSIHQAEASHEVLETYLVSVSKV